MKKLMKKLMQAIIDLGLAFALLKICDVNDATSYVVGLCTMLIWNLTDELFKEKE